MTAVPPRVPPFGSAPFIALPKWAFAQSFIRQPPPPSFSPRGLWTAVEDAIIQEWVQIHGSRYWADLAEKLPNRKVRDCRERWEWHLCGDRASLQWTEAEDEMLIRLQQQLGNKWATIAFSFRGRTASAVKNRWNSMMKKRRKQSAAVAPDFSRSPEPLSDDSSELNFTHE
jgi:hypothetical protein